MAGWVFTGWSCTGIGCYSGNINAVNISLNYNITETENFKPITTTIPSTTTSTTTIVPTTVINTIFYNGSNASVLYLYYNLNYSTNYSINYSNQAFPSPHCPSNYPVYRIWAILEQYSYVPLGSCLNFSESGNFSNNSIFDWWQNYTIYSHPERPQWAYYVRNWGIGNINCTKSSTSPFNITNWEKIAHWIHIQWGEPSGGWYECT
ncbi:MAG: hypothetical protein QXH07_04985 [Thermoplasmata archaeon]